MICHSNCQLKPYLFPLRNNRVNEGHNLPQLTVLGLRDVLLVSGSHVSQTLSASQSDLVSWSVRLSQQVSQTLSRVNICWSLSLSLFLSLSDCIEIDFEEIAYLLLPFFTASPLWLGYKIVPATFIPILYDSRCLFIDNIVFQYQLSQYCIQYMQKYQLYPC